MSWSKPMLLVCEEIIDMHLVHNPIPNNPLYSRLHGSGVNLIGLQLQAYVLEPFKTWV